MRKKSKAKDDNSFIFAWNHRNKAVLHMTVFSIVSVVLHVSGFYLFQVVYPSAVKVEPIPDRLMILDVSDPNVLALMGKVHDRVVFLRPASEGSEVRAKLDDFSIQFKPSFSDREPNVKLNYPAKALGLTGEEEGGK